MEIPNPEPIKSEMEMKAESAARFKLTRLMHPKFRNFGVRYMNMEEYQQVLSSQKIGGKEAGFYRFAPDDSGKPPFEMFLEENAGRWLRTVDHDTDWGEHSGQAVALSESFMESLKLFHKKAQKEGKDLKDVRKRTLEYLQESLKTSWNLERFLWDLERGEEEVEEEVEEETEEVKVIKDFLENPNFFEDKENLRKLFRVIIKATDLASKRRDKLYSGMMAGSRQYQVALVLDPSLLSEDKSWGTDFWRYIKSGYLTGSEILGAVVLIPEKEFVETVENTSKHAGSLGHPVFDSQGNLRFPKQELKI